LFAIESPFQVPKIISLTASGSFGGTYCDNLTESEAFEMVRELEFQDPDRIPEHSLISGGTSLQIKFEVSIS